MRAGNRVEDGGHIAAVGDFSGASIRYILAGKEVNAYQCQCTILIVGSQSTCATRAA